MTQLLEGLLIGVLVDDMSKEEPCKATAEKSNWKARINKGVGSMGVECDAQLLYDNMKGNQSDIGFRGGKEPFVAKQPGLDWKLAHCSETRFPLQAHHIIPKNYLPKHDVCAFLGAGYKHDLPFKLISDTPYDTDHHYNGYCLPYASALKEWGSVSGAKKDDLAYQLMHMTRRQLHQGSHREAQYTKDPPNAEEDDDASSDHTQVDGYLGKVGQLLNVVANHAFEHLIECRVCKPDQEKVETNPRERTVRHVDQVSGIVKRLMDADFIFVSKRAFNFARLSFKDRLRVIGLPRDQES